MRLGGRAQSWTEAHSGTAIDLGPHILLSTYPNMLQLLQRLGTEDQVHWQNGSMISQSTGTETLELNFSIFPPPFHFLPSLLLSRSVALLDVLKHGPLMARAIAVTPEEILEYDHMNAVELLRKFGVTDAAIDQLWRFVGLAILNLPLEECSGAAFLRFMGFLSGRKDYRVGFAKCGLGDLFCDSSVQVIQKAGGEVRTQTGVDHFEFAPDGRIVAAILDDQSKITPRSVILALPPQEVARLIPAPIRPSWGLGELEKFEPCPYLSVYLWFDRKVTQRAFWARSYHPDDLNCDFYDLSEFRSQGRRDQSVIASNIIYSERVGKLSDQQVVEATLKEISDQIPNIHEAKLVHSVVNRVPMAIHCPRPGTESLRPKPRAIAGHAYLAGDWIATDFPSSMEGACRAGWMAAEQLQQDQGQQASALRSQGLGELSWITRANGAVWDRVYRTLGMS
jgi:15-cis-phytoene desaturase